MHAWGEGVLLYGANVLVRGWCGTGMSWHMWCALTWAPATRPTAASSSRRTRRAPQVSRPLSPGWNLAPHGTHTFPVFKCI